jgi:hypothetical protein
LPRKCFALCGCFSLHMKLYALIKLTQTKLYGIQSSAGVTRCMTYLSSNCPIMSLHSRSETGNRIFTDTRAIATGYRLDDQRVGIRGPVEVKIFTSPCLPDRLWGPLSLLSNVYGEVKWPGHEADHSPLASAGVKKTRVYISTPPHVFMAYYLIS